MPEGVLASSPVVTELLKKRIKESKDGKITFKEFMGLALYSENGYYSGGIVDIGAATESTADFGTFPEIAPVTFGYGTAEQIVQMWENMGKPLHFQVVEMGAGNGTWASRILEYLKEKHNDLFNTLEYTIVEISPGLAKRQKEKLEPKGYPVRWVIGSAVDIKLKDVEGVFISNELPDAFAVHKVRNDDKGRMREAYVVYKDDSFKEELGEISDEQITSYINMLRIARGNEYVDTALSKRGLAVNLDMMKWQEAVYNSLKRGYVITIDTGFNGESLNAVDGQEPPLRVYSAKYGREDQIDNPDKYIYGFPGQVDIISDVDFKLLTEIGANLKDKAGFKEEGIITQYKFFLNIYEHRKEFAKLANDIWDPEVLHDDVFYVLIQSKGNLAQTSLIGLNPVSSSPLTELRGAVQKLHNKKFHINGGEYVISIEKGDSIWDTNIVLRNKDNLEIGHFDLDTKRDAINNGGMLKVAEGEREKGFAVFILSKLKEVFPENKELVTEIAHDESLRALKNNESISSVPIVRLFNTAGWELIDAGYYDSIGMYYGKDFAEQMKSDESNGEEGTVIARFKPKIIQPYLPGFNYLSSASSPLGLDTQAKIDEARLFNENEFGLIRKPGISMILSQSFPRRYVVIGDIHGDFEGLIQDLRDAGLVDIDGNWIGGDAVLIQMGDIIDRGEQSFETYQYLSELRSKARFQGGDVKMLLGNHENMFFRGMSGDSKQFSDWISNLGSSEFKNILRDTIKNKGIGIARRMILTGESGEFAKWRKLYLGFSEDIKKGEIQAAYEESGVLFVHGGITARNKHSVNAKGEADFLNRQLAVKNFDGLRDALWNSFGYEVDGEGVDYLQIVAHTPSMRDGAQVEISPNGKVVNVDVGHWKGYGGNRGYAEITGRNLQAYVLAKEEAASSPVNSFVDKVDKELLENPQYPMHIVEIANSEYGLRDPNEEGLGLHGTDLTKLANILEKGLGVGQEAKAVFLGINQKGEPFTRNEAYLSFGNVNSSGKVILFFNVSNVPALSKWDAGKRIAVDIERISKETAIGIIANIEDKEEVKHIVGSRRIPVYFFEPKFPGLKSLSSVGLRDIIMKVDKIEQENYDLSLKAGSIEEQKRIEGERGDRMRELLKQMSPEQLNEFSVDLLEQGFSADNRKIAQFTIDPFSPAAVNGSLKNKLIEAINSGQVIRLSLNNLTSEADKFNQAMSVFNLLEEILSEGIFTKLGVIPYDLKNAIRELLMNAFLHGNKLDFSLPIYLYFDFVNQKIEIYDLAVPQSQTWERDKVEAEKAGIGGKGSGLELLSQLGWKYKLDSVTALNSDSQIGNKAVAYRSSTGGIDFRALPIASQPILINQKINANTIPSIPLAELNSEWLQIENMLAAGITPSSERIKEYLQSCCQKQDFNQEIDKVLSCIADMLRLEEERVVSTDLSLKEMLMLLESGKSTNEMQLVLTQITVEAKEPRLMEQ
jgi:SAM-dependent MidA family methyltransferase